MKPAYEVSTPFGDGDSDDAKEAVAPPPKGADISGDHDCCAAQVLSLCTFVWPQLARPGGCTEGDGKEEVEGGVDNEGDVENEDECEVEPRSRHMWNNGRHLGRNE